MAWQPAADSLRQLAGFLRDSLSGFDKNRQKHAELMLQRANQSPDFNNYLAYIYSNPQTREDLHLSENDSYLIRSAAGVMLKNNIRTNWKTIDPSSLQLIKLAVPLGLQDKNPQIRSFAGNIATEVLQKSGLLGWPELLPLLLDLMDEANGRASSEAQEGAASALAKICEDHARVLTREINGQRPLNHILPQLIAATKNPSHKVRVEALCAINIFTSRESPAMNDSIDNLLQHLFVLSTDGHAEVRRQVCRAFVHLIETQPDKLLPHLKGLVDYIVLQQKSEDEDLTCEAAEFWIAVGEHEEIWKALPPFLDTIIPVLLECIIYSGEDIALLGSLSDDEDEEDRLEDIKPVFAKKSSRRTANGREGQSDQVPSEIGEAYQVLKQMEEDVEEGELTPDEDEDGDDASPDERWTVRKCSAAALDVFARDFEGPVFEAILPYLSQNLKHEEWPRREAAVLALGAVAEGCMPAVVPHLPELVPYLISLLEDAEPVVRQITCWTLVRYSSWAASLTDRSQRERYFVSMVDGILRKMLDKNKKVQQAGASAFATVTEKTGRQLEPYCGPIVQRFVQCFGKYKDRNMYILYDCVQTLAERIGPLLATPELAGQLMPALMTRFNSVPSQSREVFPLLECLSYVALAMGRAFTAYAPQIFTQCVDMIHANLEQGLAAASSSALDEPDKDYLVTSLDMLSAILQALDPPKSVQLVRGAPQPFFELLSFCLEDRADEVRQSAYALLGDCAKYAFALLQPHLTTLVPITLKQLDMDSVLDEEMDNSFGVINNACWATGEVAVRDGTSLARWVPELLQRLVEVMSNGRVPKGLCENAAIALGRLGLHNASLLAPALPTFCADFLSSMEAVDASEEKATAFQGYSAVVCANPEAMEKVLLAYFTAIAQYQDMNLQSPIKQKLHDAFQNSLLLYKRMMPQFDGFLRQMRPQDLQSLQHSYTL